MPLRKFVILDAIEKICDSGEDVKIPTLTGVWKATIPLLMDDCEEFKTSVEDECRRGRNRKRTRRGA